MKTEYEIRILEIDHDKMVDKLEKLGAKKTMDALQERYIYDVIPKVEHKWIRLRTNGDKTTLTIKNVVNSNIDGTQEMEILIDNFERGHLILKELGYEAKAFQENRRSQYLLNGCEVDIDYWPGIPTYLEIEGPSEDAVYHIVDVLGFKKEDCTSLDVQGIYKSYGIELDKIDNLKLEEERK